MVTEQPEGAALLSSTGDEPAVKVSFRPRGRHLGIPVEVFDHAELHDRIPESHRGRRQRADFNLLLVHNGHEGAHAVDFVTYPLTRGTAIRIRPGQTYQFVDPDMLPSFTVIWRVEHHVEQPGRWFPGGLAPTRFELSPATMERVLTWLRELQTEQGRFDRSPRRTDLIRTILRGILLLVEEGSDEQTSGAALPSAYVELRKRLESELYQRPSVQQLAGPLGYSSRTLDRVCQSVTGQTARQVVDERIGLELRRLLADESIPIGTVRRSFGFDEASNFSKYVRRHLGQTPGEFRRMYGS